MSEDKPFVVEGYEVPGRIVDAAMQEIGSRSGFRAGEIQAFLLEAGVPKVAVDPKYGPWGPANRIADRLLQRARRGGLIEYRKGLWHRRPAAGARTAAGA